MTRNLIRLTIDDAGHYSVAERAAIIAAWPAHERKARAEGIPMLGSGRVFPVDEDAIKVRAFEIPGGWVQIGGLDFGWDHPTAAVRLAWDRDADCIYVTASYGVREATPILHAAALKPWGSWLPWAWPHDGLQHDKGSGAALAQLYRDQGLALLPEKASFAEGGNGVEAGVAEMLDRMLSGRWKVFDHLEDWFAEFRLYHRKDGLIVKAHDDRLSASRYAMMMKRWAVTAPAAREMEVQHFGAGSWMG